MLGDERHWGVWLALAVVAVGLVTGDSAHALGSTLSCDWRSSQPVAVRGVATADIDGDRRLDSVSVVARYHARPGCHFALRARLASGRVLVRPLADPIVNGSASDLRALWWPRLLAVAKIAPGRGDQPVVSVDAGASSVVAGVFAIQEGKLVRLPVVDGEFSSGANGTASSTDCWRGRGSGMVVSSWAEAGGRDWTVTRLIYRLVGRSFRLLHRSRPPSFRVKSLIALREFRGSQLTVFRGCTVSKPR